MAQEQPVQVVEVTALRNAQGQPVMRIVVDVPFSIISQPRLSNQQFGDAIIRQTMKKVDNDDFTNQIT